jgi:hypothetical protein
MKPYSPCKGCQERALHCHNTCEKYAKYRTELSDYEHYRKLRIEAERGSEFINRYRREKYRKRQKWGAFK